MGRSRHGIGGGGVCMALRLSARVVSVLIILGTPSCGSSEPAPSRHQETIASNKQAIENARSCTASPELFQTVGKTDAATGGGNCTATRVACGVFVTAAHCGGIGTIHLAGGVSLFFTTPGIFHPTLDLAVHTVGGDSIGNPVSRLLSPGEPVDFTITTGVGTGSWWDGNVCQTPDRCRYASGAAWQAGWLYADIGVGSGDSGGPLFQGLLDGTEPNPLLLGVLQAGEVCAHGSGEQSCACNPAEYTSVSYGDGVAWLRDQISALDQDGDGLSDLLGCDNCPGPDIGNQHNYNPNQLDSDGDGVGDACDPCPCGKNWSPQECGGACPCVKYTDVPGSICTALCEGPDDADGDGVPNTCDNCPNGPAGNPDQTDSDHDGVGNICDNCPDGPPGPENANQYDADHDGFGDVCDGCRCDHNVQNPLDEPDHDWICNHCDPQPETPNWDWAHECSASGVWCLQNPPDFCPQVGDNGLNCNEVAERAMGAEILPDACDPVPCPAFDSKPKSETPVQTYPYNSAWGYVCDFATVQSSTGKVEVTPLGAHDAAGLEHSVTVQGTEYRYCINSQYVNCAYPPNIRDGFLTDLPDRGSEVGQTVWHRIWIAEITSPSAIPNPVDTTFHYPGTIPVYQRTWNWEDDFTFWSANPLPPATPIYASPYVPTVEGEGAGRLWLHAQTCVGMEDSNLCHPAGLHPNAVTGDPQLGLANAFQDLTPATQKYYKTGCRVVIADPPLELTWPPTGINMTAKPCFRCGDMQFTMPSMPNWGHPDWGYALLQVPDGSPREAQQVLTLPGLEGQPGVLLKDGSLADLTGRIGPGLQASLSLGLRWVDAVEPEPSAGIGAAGPSAVGLSADASTIMERAFVGRGGLLGQADLGIGPGPHGDPPAPRQGFQAVYSRSTQQLFVVGGEDASSHALLGDAWRADVRTLQWAQVPLAGYQVGKVLAATYSPRDRQLWILDEVAGAHGLRHARLARLKPGTGHFEILGTWLRIGLFDKLWLVVDRDGTVLLVASSNKIQKHVVVHIDNAAQPHVDNIYVGQHPLALPLLVDWEGYAFARQVNPRKMPVTLRGKSLGTGHGHWGDVGSCL